MNIRTKELLNFLRDTTPFLGKEGLANTTLVHGAFIVTNLDYFVKKVFDVENRDIISVDHKTLKKVISSYKEEFITLRIEENILEIHNGNRKITLPGQDDHIVTPEFNPINAFHFTKNEVKHMQKASKVINAGHRRDALRCVHVGSDIVGTDTYKLVKYQTDKDELVSLIPSLIFTKPRLLQGGAIVLERNGNWSRLLCADTDIYYTETVDQYPDYTQVYPDGNPQTVVSLNKKELISTLKAAGEINNTVVDVSVNHSFRINAKDEYEEDYSFEAALDAKILGEDVEFCVTPHNLVKLLNVLDEDRIELKLYLMDSTTHPIRPIVVNDTHLVMPAMGLKDR